MSSKQGIPIWQVNAFADRPFAGNPAAVCILSSYPSDQWLQHVAAEMNLSETSFIVPTDEANHFHLRWFTPTTEVDLCGHATLAAAHTLIEQNLITTGSAICFQTRSGELRCSQAGSRITLDFPLTATHPDVDTRTKMALLNALGLNDAIVMRSKFDLVVVVDDARIVESLRPNFNLLKPIETRGVVVTSASQTTGIDFVSRFFAPRCGIDEDPVTGSAHCCLAPYWGERLSKTSLVGYQASSRGGTVYCDVTGDRVLLTGNAVTVWQGRLLVTPS
jgi:PhzF family phenazine biosynthesis protein